MNLRLRHISRLILVTCALWCVSLDTYAAKQWERISQSPATEAVEGANADQYDVRIVDGAVVLTLNRKITVKLFTILGQLVAEQQLEGGVWRMPLTVRGIYILKIGDTTRRITI